MCMTWNADISPWNGTDWTKDDAEVPGDNTHLWEESWDDDDTSEDFSAQLKFVLLFSGVSPFFIFDFVLISVVKLTLLSHRREELKKVEASKKR